MAVADQNPLTSDAFAFVYRTRQGIYRFAIIIINSFVSTKEIVNAIRTLDIFRNFREFSRLDKRYYVLCGHCSDGHTSKSSLKISIILPHYFRESKDFEEVPYASAKYFSIRVVLQRIV